MYQKKVAEIIATEITSLKQTILTYTKCIDLFADIDRHFISKNKKKPKVVAALQDALKPSLQIYEKIFNIVGPNVEDFFAALNIPSEAEIKAETDPNKVEKALINLVGSEQFFRLCQLRSDATLRHNDFQATLTQLFAELKKANFELVSYDGGQSSLSLISAAAIQRSTRLQLLGKELRSVTDQGALLNDLAIQLETIAGAYTALFNESDRVKDAFSGNVSSKDNGSAKNHAQQKSEIEKVLESIVYLMAPYTQKGIENLTPDERKEFDKYRDGQGALQVKLTALKKEQLLTAQDKTALGILTKTSTDIPKCKSETSKILLAVYKALNETAPPFKRVLTDHPAYVSPIVVPSENTSDEKVSSEGLGQALRRRASSAVGFLSKKINPKVAKESSEESEELPLANAAAGAEATSGTASEAASSSASVMKTQPLDVSKKSEESSSESSSSSDKSSDEKSDLLDKFKGFGKGLSVSVKSLFKKKKRKDSSESNASEQHEPATTNEASQASSSSSAAVAITSTPEVTRRSSESSAPGKTSSSATKSSPLAERIAFFQSAIDDREQRLLEEAKRLLKKLEAFSVKLEAKNEVANGVNSAAQAAPSSVFNRSRAQTLDLGKSSVNKNDSQSQQTQSSLTPRPGM